jgi:putative queuosine salvage protein
MNLRVETADPLQVLHTTLPVVLTARHVRIDHDAATHVAGQIAGMGAQVPEWGDDLHFRDGTWRTAGWVFALDALNFCFWSDDPKRRWRVAYGGQRHDGYWALVAALRRAVDEGVQLWDPASLAALTLSDVEHMLRPSDGDSLAIPLLELRHYNLNELGRGLLAFVEVRDAHGSGTHPVEIFLACANRSAATLVEQVVTWFPSFDDVALYRGNEVRFYKRAQILAADLHGAFGGESLGAFDDLHLLTTFPDYKVPQVLRRLGVLAYDDDLARRIDAKELIPAGSEAEVEIRAATIWSCELIRQALVAGGMPMASYEIDWALWQAGQMASAEDRPYHRTMTGFY